jgi:uncharacterized membrane protein YeiB
LLNVGPIPPTPVYILVGVGYAQMIIGVCLWLSSRIPKIVRQAFASTGRLSLSWYIIHIYIFIPVYYVLASNSWSDSDWQTVRGHISIATTFVWVLFSFSGMLVLSYYWSKYFRFGPFEALIRFFTKQ